MNNNDNPSAASPEQSDDSKSPGRMLDMKNISISTMKEDLAKDSPPAEKKGGWFDFMAKHKDNPQTAPISQEPGANPPTQALAGKEPETSSLDKELEEFKALEQPVQGTIENKQPVEKPASPGNAVTPTETVEAPPNLPVGSEPTISMEPSLGKLTEKPVGKISPEPEEDLSIPDIQGKLREALGGEKLEKETTVDTVNKIKPVTDGGIAGSVVESSPSILKSGEEPTEDTAKENPFSTRIQPKETEKKSLLSSVEAALNYSAPPEFSKEREAQGANAAGGSEEGASAVVDLRKKSSSSPLGALLANKKILIIGGGSIGLIIVIVIVLSLVSGSKKTTPTTQKPVVTTTSENKNTNVAAIPIKPVVQAPPEVTAKKVLTNTLEIPIELANEITTQLEKYRQGQTVSKQSQLLFQKSDGSGATFQDLMDSTGIMIPRNILTQPSAEAALIFVDFFNGQTVFGLIVPTKDNKDLTLSKMKDWESTMIIDLSDLWKGIEIDNKAAYFADSQIFSGGRFALIDKRRGLSLDYFVQNGYILIAPGKDSMTILKNQFNPPTEATSGTGIKWEEESTTTVSGTSTTSSNINTNTNSSSNLNTSSGNMNSSNSGQ